MSLRAVIVDDEPLARKDVRRRLQTDRDVEIVGECGRAVDAAVLLARETSDLLFLDVEMPEGDGFTVLEQLSSPPPVVVLMTTDERHAIRAFDVEAFDYLLKPFDDDRFARMMSRVKQRLQNERLESVLGELCRLVGDLRSRDKYLDRILVDNGERSIFVPVADIEWVEAQGNYLRIHSTGASHLLRESIGAIEQRLDPRWFRRIHRSLIVNLDRVRELQPWFHGEYRLILTDGTELRVSRTYRGNIVDPPN